MVNRVLGASQNWIGGSAISWIHQHVVQHHIHTNDVHLDPDISGSQYVRLNPLKPLMKFHFVQHIYFFVLLAIYGFTVIYQSLCELRKTTANLKIRYIITAEEWTMLEFN